MNFNERLNFMFVWEAGALSEERTVELFQELIDLDVVWHLDSRYVNMANSLIATGECTPREFIK